jgi:hypothetical protein
MGWVRGLIGARWFPYVAIGLVVGVGAIFAYGYMQGYSSAEEKWSYDLNQALERQMHEMLEQKELEIKLALRAEAQKHDLARRIANVARPDGRCDMSDECLQWFDNILRATTTDRPKPD